jgi:hypothetical protein
MSIDEEIEKEKKKLVDDVNEYRNNRLIMMTDIKKHKETLFRIIKNGVTTPEEEKIAVVVCCIIAGDLYVEEAALMDKTGEMQEALRSPDVIDDLL